MQNVLAAVFLILGTVRRLRALAIRPAKFLVLRAADIHGHDGAHCLPELQVWLLGIAGARRDVAREVRDRDYFYLWSFSAWSVWVALGLVYLWEAMAAILGTESTGNVQNLEEQPTKSGWAFTTPILALAFMPLFVNWTSASRAGQTDTRDFAKDLLNSVEPYGVLVTVGDNDTFPLWYAQEVEGIRKGRRGREHIAPQYRLVHAADDAPAGVHYDSLAGPAVYRGHAWPKPTAPVMQMTIAQADAVPLAVRAGRARR